MKSISGLVMIFSGVMMVRMTKKEGNVHTALSRKYDGLNLNKFMISLLLTPFFERTVFLITGGLSNSEEPEFQSW